MAQRTLNEEALAECIGMVSLKWSAVEGGVKTLIYDLAAFLSPAFEDQDDEEPFQILLAMLQNMDIRAAIANAKALAYEVKGIPDFYDRAETILNRIDNQHRNERNRYIHDQWQLTGPIIHRIKRGTSIERKAGSGEKIMRHRTVAKYLGPFKLIDFTKTLEEEARLLNQLGEELRLRLNEIRPRK